MAKKPWEKPNDDLEAKVKKISGEFKKLCTPMNANDVKAAMKKNRKAAYDKEDKFADTIPAAIKKGITGKKWKDFEKDKDFKAAMNTWENSLTFQQDLVRSLETISDKSKKHFQDLKRALGDFESDVKKTGEKIKTNKALKKTFDDAKSLLDDVEEAMGAFGKLSAKEAFFGANIKKSKDVVVTNALKAGGGDELPDILLEHPKRQQTDNKAKRLVRNVHKHLANARTLCAKDKFLVIPPAGTAKTALESDVKNAKVSLKNASDYLKQIQSLNTELQNAKKKQAKLIAAHNEKGKMLSLIDDVANSHKATSESFDAVQDLVEDADAVL